jgi:polyisoprenoid-binding protein YceI
MLRKMKLHWLFIALLGLAATTEGAEFNQVQLDKSAISFSYKQMGVSVDGKFRKFTAKLSFDPSKPTSASAQVEVDLASIDTGSSEGDEEAAGKLWFNSKAFPTAKFVSSSVKVLGPDRYEATGKLTIKGKTVDAVAPLTFKQTGNIGIFEGSFVMKRLDFAIGEGAWADVSTVANEVPVKFRITAAGNTAAKK